jgi:hypothetical protein
MRPVAHGDDPALDVGDVVVRRMRLQHDDHVLVPFTPGEMRKAAGSTRGLGVVNAAGCRSAPRLLISLRQSRRADLGEVKVKEVRPVSRGSHGVRINLRSPAAACQAFFPPVGRCTRFRMRSR